VKFKCSVDQAKKSFYRAANSIFAKVGRLASEEVAVELLKCKCLPILLYALEVCNLNKSTLQSLDFTLNRFFMKLFKTSNMEIVTYCQEFFGCDLPSVVLRKRYSVGCCVILCQFFVKSELLLDFTYSGCKGLEKIGWHFFEHNKGAKSKMAAR